MNYCSAEDDAPDSEDGGEDDDEGPQGFVDQEAGEGAPETVALAQRIDGPSLHPIVDDSPPEAHTLGVRLLHRSVAFIDTERPETLIPANNEVHSPLAGFGKLVGP